MALEKALKYTVLTGVFLLPFIVLYVSDSMFFPFISGKNFAFRIIVETIAGLWIALALVYPQYRPRMSALLYTFAFFVVWMAIADFFGVYPFKSFWSNYERMEGLVTLLHLFAYFVVAISMLTTEKLWRYWWHTSLAVSVIVAFIGLSQLGGLVDINQGNIRIDARIGNATYLAVYMLFHIFMAGLFLAQAWVREGKGKRLLPVSLYGALIALNSFVLFFTATRGAILGLFGGALLAALILIVIAPRSRVAWRAGVVIGVAIVLAGGFWLVRDAAWVHRIEPLRRLATITNDGITIARFINVEMAIEGFKERPILGWGQENYSAVFDKYYDPRMYAQEQWFDRTHNIIFDWLIAGGILGLLAYLGLYAFALLALWRSGAFKPYERAILTGLFAGYFFYLLFTFDNITSYILFVALLAYIIARAKSVDSDPPTRIAPLPKESMPIVAALACVGIGASIWFLNVPAIASNRILIQSLMPQQGGAAKNLELFREALAYESVGTQEIREQLSQAAMSAVAQEGIAQDVKQGFVQLAATEMTKHMADAPQNARAPFFLGLMLDRAGAYDDAKIALDEALKRSPKKQGILFELGLNALVRGAQDESIAYFKQAYDFAPEYLDARYYYAAALIRAGRDAEADTLLAPIIEAGNLNDQAIAAAYAERGQFQKIVAIWMKWTEKHPTDLNGWLVLAGAHYSAGDRTNSIRVLEEAKRQLPGEAARINDLIGQVQAGTAR